MHPESVYTLTYDVGPSDANELPITIPFDQPPGQTQKPTVTIQPICDSTGPAVFAVRVVSVSIAPTCQVQAIVTRVNPAGSTVDPQGWRMGLRLEVQFFYPTVSDPPPHHRPAPTAL
jgi:hypothetical protein